MNNLPTVQGNWAWGMGHGAWGIERDLALFPLPIAHCPLNNCDRAQFPILNDKMTNSSA
ncbi:hypothetical protein [Tolypothrix sp. VBCCA 56010]|uniref:hypothetical protein n=1 Tax=Tolypothrix sp. VBCCA 56010 TaxID=3137731 RepID=UPI003D7CEB1F